MGIGIVISNTSGVPIYEQIKQQLKDAILSGVLSEDDALPSIRALARDLKVSVITTTRAYSDLVTEGFVTNVPGKGYYVLPRNSELVREQLLREVEDHLERAIDRARIADLSRAELHDALDYLIDNAGETS